MKGVVNSPRDTREYTCASISYVTDVQHVWEAPKIRRHPPLRGPRGRGKLVPFEFRVVIPIRAREKRQKERRWYTTSCTPASPSRILANVRALHAARSNARRCTCFRFLNKISHARRWISSLSFFLFFIERNYVIERNINARQLITKMKFLTFQRPTFRNIFSDSFHNAAKDEGTALVVSCLYLHLSWLNKLNMSNIYVKEQRIIYTRGL